MVKHRSYWIFPFCLFFLFTFFISAKADSYSPQLTDFLGEYYLNDPDPSYEYQNPSIMQLDFDGEGVLYRCDKLKYGTVGSTSYVYYTSQELNYNVLICKYDSVRGYYGADTEQTGGTHTFILTEEGNIVENGNIWYRRKDMDDYEESGTLLNAKKTDFPDGKYSNKSTFLGIQDLKRKDIETVLFTDSMWRAPDNAWDVSANQDHSVLAWLDHEFPGTHVVIAAENGVYANTDSSNLFRCCSNLKRIIFNDSLHTESVTQMDYMFCGCEKLETIYGLEDIETTYVNNMKKMFADCQTLRNIELKSFQTDNVLDMSEMFLGCKSLKSLDVSNFVFQDRANYENIYTGTKWENSSPMKDLETDIGASVSYLYNYDEIDVYKPGKGKIQISDNVLKSKIVNSYDSILVDMWLEENQRMAANDSWYNLSDSYKRADVFMYAFYDFEQDGIPEMITAVKHDGFYNLSVYSFSVAAWKVEERYLYTAWPDRLYTVHVGKNTLEYQTDYDVHVMKLSGDSFNEKYSYNSLEESGEESLEPLVFSSIWTDKLYDNYLDLDGNGESEEINVYGTNSLYGYRYLTVTRNDEFIYSAPRDYFNSVEIETFENEGEKALLQMSFDQGTSEAQTSLFEYFGFALNETITMNDLVNPLQLAVNGDNSDFHVFSVSRNFENGEWNAQNPDYNMSIELSLNTVTFGKMKMIVPYHYHDHSLYQNSFYFWSGDIPGKNYFIYPENAVIYKRLGSSADSETYELSAGSKLYVIGYWFKEGLIWVHVANEDHIGWMPLISENTSINLFDYSNEEVDKWVAENSEKSYFDNSIVFPDLEEVQQSGLQLLQEGINTDISSDLYKLEEALLILDIGEKSKELQTETEDMVNQIKSSDEYSAIWDILESLMDEGSFDELYIHLLGLSYLLDDEEKYQTYLDICLDHLFSVSSDSDNGQITQEAEYSKTAWSALVEQLIVRFGKEEELAYAEADFDHDQVNEVVIRRRDSEVPGEGSYVYRVFRYNSAEDELEELPDALFYSFYSDSIKIYYWEEMEYLVLDVTFGDTEFEVLSLQGETWETKYTTSEDLSFLPYLVFQPIEPEEEASSNILKLTE